MKEIYFEWQVFGNSAKVTAIDPESLLEVSIIVPHNTLEQDAHRLALQKLQRKLGQIRS